MTNMERTPEQAQHPQEEKFPKTDITVKLVGTDGNAFALIGKVRQALRRGGYGELVEEFTKEATSGDYDHVLQTIMEYVDVE